MSTSVNTYWYLTLGSKMGTVNHKHKSDGPFFDLKEIERDLCLGSLTVLFFYELTEEQYKLAEEQYES